MATEVEYLEQRQRVIEEMRVLLELADELGKEAALVAGEFMAAFQLEMTKVEIG
jgi:hypothetical protein